jgi:copper chaperone CopZ
VSVELRAVAGRGMDAAGRSEGEATGAGEIGGILTDPACSNSPGDAAGLQDIPDAPSALPDAENEWVHRSGPMSAPGREAVASRHRTSEAAVVSLEARIRNWLLWLLLVIGPATPAWAGATGTRVELLLHGMDCSLCVQGLEQRLRSLPGAQQVLLDLERGRLSLQFRPGSMVADQTLRTLMRDAGFAVRQIRRSPVAP